MPSADALLVLNSDQQRVFDACLHHEESVFCTGPAGTGKSMLARRVAQALRIKYANGSCVAITGATVEAAYHLHGTPLHKFSGLDYDRQHYPACREIQAGRYQHNWLVTDVLLIDEVSVVPSELFNMLSELAKCIRSDARPFGGIRVIMFGDFLQLPPRDAGGCSVTRVDRAFESRAWKELAPECMELRTDCRTTDQEFSRILDDLRFGICNKDASRYILSMNQATKLQEDVPPINMSNRRIDTLELNSTKLRDDICGPEIVYRAEDSGSPRLLEHCPAMQTLKLKLGSQVMCIGDPDQGLIDGCVGVVVGFYMTYCRPNILPFVRMVQPDGQVKATVVGVRHWLVEDNNRIPISIRTQLPLTLGYATTVHQSQGRTVTHLEIDMTGVHEPGQAYTALSRCTNPSAARVFNFDRTQVVADPACVKFHVGIRVRDERAATVQSSPVNTLRGNECPVVTSTIYPIRSRAWSSDQGRCRSVSISSRVDDHDEFLRSWAEDTTEDYASFSPRSI